MELNRTQPSSHNVRCFGKVRPAILLWALGVPIPIVLLIVLLRGCM